ncbi:MAG: hypothetical protein HDS77_08370 [Bacteroidales bacterium]|nr:hypothetical protein [Bacteroidales bacterium]MBD5211262.1 hypothetical protein [Bacteroidales bacterium]
MAKTSEIIGEYIVTIDDNNSVSVSRIYKSTMKALTEIAESKGIEVLKTWTTQHLGRLLLTQYCNGEKEGTIGEYTIEREANNRINVIRTYSNTMDGLREAAKVIGYTEDPKEKGWNTQNFGRHLVIYAQSLKTK